MSTSKLFKLTLIIVCLHPAITEDYGMSKENKSPLDSTNDCFKVRLKFQVIGTKKEAESSMDTVDVDSNDSLTAPLRRENVDIVLLVMEPNTKERCPSKSVSIDYHNKEQKGPYTPQSEFPTFEDFLENISRTVVEGRNKEKERTNNKKEGNNILKEEENRPTVVDEDILKVGTTFKDVYNFKDRNNTNESSNNILESRKNILDLGNTNFERENSSKPKPITIIKNTDDSESFNIQIYLACFSVWLAILAIVGFAYTFLKKRCGKAREEKVHVLKIPEEKYQVFNIPEENVDIYKV